MYNQLNYFLMLMGSESLCTYLQIQHVPPTEETRLNCLFDVFQTSVCAE